MKRLFTALLLTVAAVGTADAATLSYSGSTTFTLNNFDLSGTTGLANGTTVFRERHAGNGLYLSGPANLTLTYLGREAGDTNLFRMPGTTEIFRTGVSLVGSSTTLANVAGGLINFNFLDLVPLSLIYGDIANGEGNHSEKNSIAVFMESATSALVLFNDFGHDRDYDDMAVRIQVSPIPVPAALPLLATGLAGLGYVARRRKTKAKVTA